MALHWVLYLGAFLPTTTTPIEDAFKWVSDKSFIPFSLEAATIPGLILCAILARTLGEFIYYWLHRVQHVTLLGWRIHATHHHITKMGAAHRPNAPTRILALGLHGNCVGILGASEEVIAVTAAFSFTGGCDACESALEQASMDGSSRLLNTTTRTIQLTLRKATAVMGAM